MKQGEYNKPKKANKKLNEWKEKKNKADLFPNKKGTKKLNKLNKFKLNWKL